MKVDWAKVSFAAAFVVCGVLVALGKLPAAYLAGLAAAGHLLPDGGGQ